MSVQRRTPLAPLCLALTATLLSLVAGAASAQTPVAPDCTGFEYDQKPTNLGWSTVPQFSDEEPGASGMTLEEGIVNGSGTLVALTGSTITRVKVWGWSFDFVTLDPPVGDPATPFCSADLSTPFNITFRAASGNPQIPGALLATRTVSFSTLLFSTAGINFNTDGGPPGPRAPCNSGETGCTITAEWTFDFPPVPSQDVRWIGVQQQQGNNAPDGSPCAQVLLTEADTATYDDEVYQRGGAAEDVNQDLQICVGTSELATLDIDGNAVADALTDGLLGLRSLFGFTGATLITGAVGTNCTRCSANQIGNYAQELADLDILDVDGNGTPDPLTDGLLFLRYLFGFRGSTLIAGAVAAGAPRDTADEIEDYIAGLI
jgi:hypothetical protein